MLAPGIALVRFQVLTLALAWLSSPSVALAQSDETADPTNPTEGKAYYGDVPFVDVRSILVKTRVPLTPDVVSSFAEGSYRISYVWPEIRTMAMQVPSHRVAGIVSDPLVENVEEDTFFDLNQAASPSTPSGTVVVPIFSEPPPIWTWNLDMADVTGSGKTGAGVTVAVVDAGLPQNWEEFLPAEAVDLEHAAGFGPQGWGDFRNPVRAVVGAGGYYGLFPHGLAVSSIIVGFPSDWGPIAGSAPGAKILPVRVINQFNFCWASWCAAGILHVANLKASGAIPGPVVINFSIQFASSPLVMAHAIQYAISKGVVFVTVAGNFNPSRPVSFPGRLPQSITAAACGWRSEGTSPTWFFADVPENDPGQVYVASFSGREPISVPPGTQIDVLAPGSHVFGEWLFGPGYSEGRQVAFDDVDNFIFGTSFAAPHVAGIVAQMLEKNPGLDQGTIESILRATALPIAPSPVPVLTPLRSVPSWDARATGAGLVRGAAAVAATPAPPAPAGPEGLAASAEPTSGLEDAVRVTSRPGARPVRFDLGRFGGRAEASLFDLTGRRVRGWSAAGAALEWDGRTDDGRDAGAGIYFLRVEGRGRATTKVVLAP
jgi:subtilisin family serine protease